MTPRERAQAQLARYAAFHGFGASDSQENPMDPALARTIALNICKQILSLIEGIEGRTTGVAALGVPEVTLLQWKSIAAIGRDSVAKLIRQVDDGRFKTSYDYRVAWMGRAAAAVTGLTKAKTKDGTALEQIKTLVKDAADETKKNLKDIADKLTDDYLEIVWSVMKKTLTHPAGITVILGAGLWYFGPALGLLAKRKLAAK